MRKRKILTQKFFQNDTQHIAVNLLGKFLTCQTGDKKIALPITEVEVYDGTQDIASHAYRGRTKRNSVMWGPAGYWYVYLCYGMHEMLNIVTGPNEYPAAILIRGVEGINGPGRVTKHFRVDRRFNTKPASYNTGLWIEDRGIIMPPKSIKKSPRIGIPKGSVWSKRLLRFYI